MLLYDTYFWVFYINYGYVIKGFGSFLCQVVTSVEQQTTDKCCSKQCNG